MLPDPNDPVDYPIDGTLDLHQFQPSEVKPVVEEYIRACLERGILQLRIVHGKGIGVQREIVRSILERHPNVISFHHEEGSGGGWGATVVDLRKA
jgi:DNA-nicking Smr family endonuclease